MSSRSNPLVAVDTTNVSVLNDERGGSPARTGWNAVNRYVPRIAPSTASLMKSTQPARSNAALVRPFAWRNLAAAPHAARTVWPLTFASSPRPT